MHTAGYIHRDVKPANVMLQPSDALGETKVLLVDFGLSRKYCDAHGKHCPAKQAQPGKFRGTTAYASIHSHRGESENEREKEKEKEKEKGGTHLTHPTSYPDIHTCAPSYPMDWCTDNRLHLLPHTHTTHTIPFAISALLLFLAY